MQTQTCAPATLKHFWQEKSFIFPNLPYSSAKFLSAIGDDLSCTNFFSVNCQVTWNGYATDIIKSQRRSNHMFRISRFFWLPWKNNVTKQYILERSGCKHKHVHLQLSYISSRRKVWYFPISRTPHMCRRSAPFLKVSKHSKLIHQHCHFIWNVKTVDISHFSFSFFLI